MSEAPRTGRRLPVRVRLTAVFAIVVGFALALTGFLVYLQFRSGLDARIDAELVERQASLVAIARAAGSPERLIGQAGERLAQVYRPDGAVAASTRALAGVRLLDPAAVAAVAAGSPSSFTKDHLRGQDDGARVRAFALVDGRVAAIAEGRDDRERALHRLATILAITLPGALVAASAAGYLVARSALRPVEEMRARADEIGAGDLGQRLPEPGTRDELARLATTLNGLLGRLEGAVEHERRVVGDASHELRTPVSVLTTRLDVALRQDLDADGLREVLEAARGDARRLSRLADDLLVLARADQGRLPLRPVPLEVHELLRAARERHAATGPEVVVREEVAGGAVVLADAARTDQVLDNLLVNALTHGAGPVELWARTDPAGIAISVRDHGPGYPPAFLPRAFERFSQGDPTGDGDGAGLGLAIAEALVTAQGGTVSAANAPGGGAVVTVTLPRA